MSPKRPKKGGKRERNYKAEYARRIDRGRKAGIDPSVARGHPKAGLLGIRVARSLKVPPGTRIEDIQVRRTGKEVEEETKQRLKETLSEMGVSTQRLGGIDFNDEESVIKLLLDLGFTSREAYTLRFSP